MSNSYILDQNSPFVRLLQFIVQIVVLCNVILNLYLIAFGIKEEQVINTLVLVSEIIFLIEIIQNFFTSYSDPEHYEVIDEFKLIAQRYIFYGSFIFHALAVIPW